MFVKNPPVWLALGDLLQHPSGDDLFETKTGLA
jgi:hypothetical protein